MKNGNCDAILGEIQDAVRVCNERICPGQGGQRRPPHEKVALNNDRAQKRRGGGKCQTWAKALWQERASGSSGLDREHCGWSGMRKGNQSRAHVDLEGRQIPRQAGPCELCP